MSVVSPDISSSGLSPDIASLVAALADPSVLFETAHGSVSWAENGAVTVHLDDVSQTVSQETVRSLHRSVRSLARDVYYCEHGCRWQVRLPSGTVLVLNSDDVLRLDTLLEGAATMVDLYDLLDANGISAAAQ